MVINHLCIITCLWALVVNVCGSPWASPAQEKLDELQDAEIAEAIITSVQEWKQRRARHLHNRNKREQPSVCYEDLGCFDATGPFAYLEILPGSPDEIGTKFMLYPTRSQHRKCVRAPLEITYDNITAATDWAENCFNNTLPVKVIIHGFGGDCSHIWVYEMRSALMAVEDANIICVDWKNGATLPNYVKATANSRLVGKQLSLLLKALSTKRGFSSRQMHLVGFSLGAHVAGFAGAEFSNLSRITGLDPAGPLFESQDPRARLDPGDADFVDVIHSNGDNILVGGFGFSQPLGHVDFYPNGGKMQKGCYNVFVGAVSDMFYFSPFESRSLCNHRRAYRFFTDSVSPRCQFPAFPCQSYDDFLAGKCFPCNDDRQCGNMGYYADRSKGRGKLYLMTRDEEPFCAHEYQIKIESFATEVPIISYGKIQITLISDSLLNETFTLTKNEDEEIQLGTSISRIIVPHPVLLEPTRIEILYKAYSGWISSGLLQWKIDKITMRDSFGRSLSYCKKNLILDSGVPVVLPLFPGECNLPNKDSEVAEDRIDEKVKNYTFDVPQTSKFVPTPVVRIGEPEKNRTESKDPFEIFNLSWNDNNNIVDTENEQSRAFNTRVVKMTKENTNASDSSEEEVIREVVEPILKTHSHKNGRSHDPTRDKPEITEPILGPTTVRVTTEKPNVITRFISNNKEVNYSFADGDDDWLPSANPVKKSETLKRKREDESKALSQQEPTFAGATLIQFFPTRIARMIEDAQDFARTTLLPLISNFTPQSIAATFYPRPQQTPKYLPLKYEENPEKVTPSIKILRSIVDDKNEKNKAFDPPPGKIEELTKTDDGSDVLPTTPYTHIQKIAKKIETVTIVYPEELEATTVVDVDEGRSVGRETSTTKSPESSSTMDTKGEVVTKSQVEDIFLDLPVFEDKKGERKYIPLARDEVTKNSTKTKTNS